MPNSCTLDLDSKYPVFSSRTPQKRALLCSPCCGVSSKHSGILSSVAVIASFLGSTGEMDFVTLIWAVRLLQIYNYIDIVARCTFNFIEIV